MPRSLDGRNDTPDRRYSGWIDLYGMTALTVFLAIVVVLGFVFRH